MLDKSLPYADVLMHRPAGAAIPDVPLPEGYRALLYRSGDEKDWARLETSVLEFDEEMDALLYFQKEYLRHPGEAERRCLFIADGTGKKVATASAWWMYSGQRRDPWLHWISVHPSQQGKGLGKALVSAVMQLVKQIEGDRDVYLHTQTWSYPAIKLYEKMGFSITREPNLSKYKNDREQVDKALDILAGIERDRAARRRD